MAYLLRRIGNIGAWAQISDSPEWEDGNCPAEALRDIYDNRTGVSMWRVETPEDIERVVAAQAFIRSTIGNFAYFLIEEKHIRAAGIKIESKPAKTADKEANNRHVDLVNLTGKQAIMLARLANLEFSPDYIFAREEVITIGARLFKDGKLDRSYLFEKGKRGEREAEVAAATELLVNLWKKKEVDLVS